VPLAALPQFGRQAASPYVTTGDRGFPGVMARMWHGRWVCSHMGQAPVTIENVCYVRLYSWIAHMFPSGSSKKQ
jgi:hypothetical protein